MMGKFVFLAASLVFGAAIQAQAQNVVKADGSSTVFPVTEAVAEEFQSSQKGKIRVTVGKSGTGGGFKKFCRGETDVQNASRPIQTTEMEACKKAGVRYFEIPIAYDAIVVIVNPKNDWVKDITVAELKKMWSPEAQGKLNLWSDINPAWPKEKMRLFGAGSDSGTFDYFTEAINGKSKASRGDFTGSEDDNILIKGVSTDQYAIGFVPFSYYEENKKSLRALGIISPEKSKSGVVPTLESIETGAYFPLSRPIFIYISEKSYAKPEVKAFAEFFLQSGPDLIREVKYVPLPKQVYTSARENLKNNKLGTAFGGHSDVGMKIEELLKKETTL